MSTWDDRFMGLAKEVSSWSKDPSSKVGAVIVGPDHEVRATGYNGFPRGVEANPERWERPAKYIYVVHAEANAIANAAMSGTSSNGCTIYISGLLPCSACAGAIIQSGITKVVVSCVVIPKRWDEQMRAALQMLKEAKVEFIPMAKGESVPSHYPHLSIAYWKDGKVSVTGHATKEDALTAVNFLLVGNESLVHARWELNTRYRFLSTTMPQPIKESAHA